MKRNGLHAAIYTLHLTKNNSDKNQINFILIFFYSKQIIIWLNNYILLKNNIIFIFFFNKL